MSDCLYNLIAIKKNFHAKKAHCCDFTWKRSFFAKWYIFITHWHTPWASAFQCNTAIQKVLMADEELEWWGQLKYFRMHCIASHQLGYPWLPSQSGHPGKRGLHINCLGHGSAAVQCNSLERILSPHPAFLIWTPLFVGWQEISLTSGSNQMHPPSPHHTAQCVLCKVRCHCIFSGPGIRYSDIFCVPGIRYSVIIKLPGHLETVHAPVADTVTYFGGNHGSRVWKSLKGLGSEC